MKNRLKQERLDRGWSQGELAERVDASRQTINAVEADKYDPSLPLAFRLAAVFDLPVERLFANPYLQTSAAK
jgi:putative transcriptional regulator